MKRILTAMLLVLVATVAFAGETGAGSAGDSDLVGRWRWVSVKMGMESAETGEDASNYLLTFNADGTFIVKSDCRSGSGRYTADGSMLSMTLAEMTDMQCDSGSLTDEFERLLGEVGSFKYSIESKTTLSFSFAAGAGSAEFFKINDAM